MGREEHVTEIINQKKGQQLNPYCANTPKQPYINRRLAKLRTLRVIKKSHRKIYSLLSWGIFAVIIANFAF